MSSPFSHLSRSVTRSGSSVTRGLFSTWSSSRHDGQPHKADDRRRRTSCESKTLQAQSNVIAVPIRRAFIFNQLMHALLLSFCRYFAKIADARGAMSLSLVKCQVKKFLSAACACVRGSAILCYHDCCHRISLTCAHSSSRALTTPFCQVAAPKQPWKREQVAMTTQEERTGCYDYPGRENRLLWLPRKREHVHKRRLTNSETFQVLSWKLAVLLAHSVQLAHYLLAPCLGPGGEPFALGAANSDLFTFHVVRFDDGWLGIYLAFSKRWLCAGCWKQTNVNSNYKTHGSFHNINSNIRRHRWKFYSHKF